jgi:hypothetical protein
MNEQVIKLKHSEIELIQILKHESVKRFPGANYAILGAMKAGMGEVLSNPQKYFAALSSPPAKEADPILERIERARKFAAQDDAARYQLTIAALGLTDQYCANCDTPIPVNRKMFCCPDCECAWDHANQ